MIIIFSIWFGNTKLKAFPFHVVKKSMYKSCSYCCNRCWKNPIFYIFLLKKKFQKKIFVQKKSKNQNWPIFDFSLIGSSVFELEPKTAKLRKQVELCPQGCFYLLTKELFIFIAFPHEVACGEVIKQIFLLPSHMKSPVPFLVLHLSLHPYISSIWGAHSPLQGGWPRPPLSCRVYTIHTWLVFLFNKKNLFTRVNH